MVEQCKTVFSNSYSMNKQKKLNSVQMGWIWNRTKKGIARASTVFSFQWLCYATTTSKSANTRSMIIANCMLMIHLYFRLKFFHPSFSNYKKTNLFHEHKSQISPKSVQQLGLGQVSIYRKNNEWKNEQTSEPISWLCYKIHLNMYLLSNQLPRQPSPIRFPSFLSPFGSEKASPVWSKCSLALGVWSHSCRTCFGSWCTQFWAPGVRDLFAGSELWGPFFKWPKIRCHG